MLSERAQERQLRRDITAAATKRFGTNRPFRIYCDTSDGDPEEFDACLQHVKQPPGGASWAFFPLESVITEKTVLSALRGLLAAIQKKPGA